MTCDWCGTTTCECVATLRHRVIQLLEALDTYARHRPSCRIHTDPSLHPRWCTCGLQAAMTNTQESADAQP